MNGARCSPPHCICIGSGAPLDPPYLSLAPLPFSGAQRALLGTGAEDLLFQ